MLLLFDIDFISESQVSLQSANTSIWWFAKLLEISRIIGRISSGPHSGKYFIVNLEINLFYSRLHGEALWSRYDYWGYRHGNSGLDTVAEWEYHSIPLLLTKFYYLVSLFKSETINCYRSALSTTLL